MSIFRKKIDTIEYWKNKVDYLFSVKFENAFQLLKKTKSELLNQASEINLRNHIIASYIALINITIAKNNGNREKRYKIIQLRDAYIKGKCETDNSIIGIMDVYNKEFGSSMTDGIRPMARSFSLSIQTDNEKELKDFIYDLFYATLTDSFNDFKKIRLV